MSLYASISVTLCLSPSICLYIGYIYQCDSVFPSALLPTASMARISSAKTNLTTPRRTVGYSTLSERFPLPLPTASLLPSFPGKRLFAMPNRPLVLFIRSLSRAPCSADWRQWFSVWHRMKSPQNAVEETQLRSTPSVRVTVRACVRVRLRPSIAQTLPWKRNPTRSITKQAPAS